MTVPPDSVWLDVQGTQNREHFDRGIPRYIRDHALGLVRTAPEAIAAVGLNPDLPLTGNLDAFVGTGLLRWRDQRRPERVPRVFHVMSPFELQLPLDAVWPPWARTIGVKTVVTLYDLIPLVFADHYLRDPVLRASYMARAEFVRRADHVLAISQTTADDVTRLLGVPPERVTTIDAGVSQSFADAFATQADARQLVSRRFPELGDGFMLYVAGIEYRKNIERLIEAHGRIPLAVRDRHQLVVCCRMQPEDDRRLRALAADVGLRERDVVFTNYVTDLELAALYGTCRLFVFASFYEGSGLPILEAMACGAPVAASSTSTSPEILGDADATFDPHDAGDMAAVLEQTVTDDGLLARLRERSAARVGRYTWERVATATMEGYERVLSPAPRRRPRRPRIAIFTPWPPERSGIASYSERLVHELAEHVEVDVVVQHATEGYAAPRERDVRLVPAEDFDVRARLRSYDRLVYAMGNSHFHHYIHEQLARTPGAVICHDIRLGGLYASFAEIECPEEPSLAFAQRLAAQYGTRLGRSFADGPPDPWTQRDLGIYLTGEVQRQAELLLVHSRYAAELLRLDVTAGRTFADPPTAVVPLAFPPVGPRRLREPAARGGTIVSFGIVSATKSPDVLIEAVGRLRAQRPDLRLVFAGGAAPADLEEVRALAVDLGLADAVEVLGHVDDAGWDALLDTADVAVQLRRMTNGEASAAVTQTMAAGVPTVVTDQGWASELPGDAVAKVPYGAGAGEVAEAIAALLDDPEAAGAVTAAAQAHAGAAGFAAVAARYLELLELA